MAKEGAGPSTVAIPKLALLTDLLTMGLGRSLELKKVPCTEDNSLSLFQSHSLVPASHSWRKIPPQCFITMSFPSVCLIVLNTFQQATSVIAVTLKVVSVRRKWNIMPDTFRKMKGLFCSNATMANVVTQGSLTFAEDSGRCSFLIAPACRKHLGLELAFTPAGVLENLNCVLRSRLTQRLWHRPNASGTYFNRNVPHSSLLSQTGAL